MAKKRMRRTMVRSEQAIRVLRNDPDYEQINGLRQASECKFYAKVLAVMGVPLILVVGIGLVFLVVAGGYYLHALSLEAKFRQ